MKVPKKLQAVLWSVNVDQLDIVADKNYIIHQVLSYGRLEDMRWLFQMYTKENIKKVFIHVPYKDYEAARFQFVKRYLLNLKQYPLDERLYAKIYLDVLTETEQDTRAIKAFLEKAVFEYVRKILP